MDNTPQKVTKDPKIQEATRKGRENYLKKLKEGILNDPKKGVEDTSNLSFEAIRATISATTSSTDSTTVRSGDTYLYAVGIVAFISICVPFAYSKKSHQAANK